MRQKALLNELRETGLFDKLLAEKRAKVLALQERLTGLSEGSEELQSQLTLLNREPEVLDALGGAAQEAARALPSFAEFRVHKGAKLIRDLSLTTLPVSERNERFAATTRELRDEIARITELEAALERSAGNQRRLRTDTVRLDQDERTIVKNKLSYFEFLMTCMDLTTLPENLHKLNTTHYCVENNLPVEKQLLYEICPEMFNYEIEDMEEVARRKVVENAVRLEFKAEGLLTGAGPDTPAKSADEELVGRQLRQRHKMMRLLERRVEKGFARVEPFLLQNFRDERKATDFLDLLMARAPGEITDPNELIIYETITAGQAMLEDILLSEQKFEADFDALRAQIQMPFFVYRHPRLRESWLQKHAESMIDMDISESIALPRAEPTPDFIEEGMSPAERKVLMRSTSIAPGPIAPQLRDHDSAEKAEERVLRAQVMGDVLNRIADDVKSNRIQLDAKYDQLPPQEEEEEMPALAFRAGRVSLEELIRCLYLNNSDPQRYNLAFFADYFDVPVKDLGEMFDVLSFPVVVGSEVGKVYRFFSDVD